MLLHNQEPMTSCQIAAALRTRIFSRKHSVCLCGKVMVSFSGFPSFKNTHGNWKEHERTRCFRWVQVADNWAC